MEITVSGGRNPAPNHFLFSNLSESELLDCHGGKVPASIWGALASLIISNWQDIREGFSDGISGKGPRY